MARTHVSLSKEILERIAIGASARDVFQLFSVRYERKAIYDALFRLRTQGLIVHPNRESDPIVLSPEGAALLSRVKPVRDGVWKLIIFDIPEKKRAIRNHLRAKLKTLGFKKWQASIWITPYKLDPSIEQELTELAGTLFVRLIKTTDINYTKDLEGLFKKESI